MRRVLGGAFVAATIACLLFLPVEGQDSIPSRQWGVFGNEVPSPDRGLALTLGALVFTAVLLVLMATRRWWRLDR